MLGVVVRLLLQHVLQGREAERVGRRGHALAVLGPGGKAGLGSGRKRELLRDRAARRADVGHVDRLPEPAAARINGQRAGERADVQAIVAAVGAAEGTLADLDHVGAVAGDDHRAGTVLAQERRVVGRRQHEAIGVHDRHRRIEERFAQPQALHLDAQPLALLGLDGIVVDVLVAGPRR